MLVFVNKHYVKKAPEHHLLHDGHKSHIYVCVTDGEVDLPHQSFQSL